MLNTTGVELGTKMEEENGELEDKFVRLIAKTLR